MIPRVYAAINAVSEALSREGIAKHGRNREEDYDYRRIDDVYNRLSPLLAAHKLCILPRVLERTATDRQGLNGELLVCVTLRVAFDLVSVEDGSVHTIEAYGEALDAGDKGTAKAVASAYKYALLQVFCIPVTGSDDADATTHRLARVELPVEPVQGWSQWTVDIIDMLRICESLEAVDRVQSSNRELLRSLSRERPELYTQLGEAVAARRAALTAPRPVGTGATKAAASVDPASNTPAPPRRRDRPAKLAKPRQLKELRAKVTSPGAAAHG